MAVTIDTGPRYAPPSAAVEAFRQDYAALRRKSRRNWLIASILFIIAFIIASDIGELFKVVRVGDERMLNLIAGIPRLGEFIEKILPTLRWETLGADLAEWFLPWRTWLRLLLETILIAFMATVFGVIGGFLLSFPASRNLAPRPWILWVSRRYLEIARTVPELVWALIFVYCFSVGPLAGVLAIGLHATGALGKLYSGANENIDPRPVEGVRASGGDWFQQVRYGVVPQVLPNILSYTLLRFEINVRASSIIGFVGAGGLGQEIRTAISFQYYTDISALFLIILVTVAVIDFGCEKLRHRVIGIGKAV